MFEQTTDSELRDILRGVGRMERGEALTEGQKDAMRKAWVQHMAKQGREAVALMNRLCRDAQHALDARDWDRLDAAFGRGLVLMQEARKLDLPKEDEQGVHLAFAELHSATLMRVPAQAGALA